MNQGIIFLSLFKTIHTIDNMFICSAVKYKFYTIIIDQIYFYCTNIN